MVNGINFQQLTAGVVFLIMLMVGVMQLYTSVTAIGAARSIQGDINRFERLGDAGAGFGKDLDVAGVKDGSQQKYGYVAMARIGEFHDFRSVRVSDTARVKDLLADGESAPDPELLEAFAMARAAQIAEAECAVLKERLAAECRVSGSHGSAGRGGLIEIGFSLDFIQRDPLGEIRAERRAVYVESEKRLAEKTLSGPLAPQRSRALRAEIYGKAAAVCAKIRASAGNCAIFALRVAAARTGNGLSLRSDAVFTSIAKR
jgi:hypothetical protein